MSDTQPSAGQDPAADQAKCRQALACVAQPPARAANFTPHEAAACAAIHDACVVRGEGRLDEAMAEFLAGHERRLRLDAQKGTDADDDTDVVLDESEAPPVP